MNSESRSSSSDGAALVGLVAAVVAAALAVLIAAGCAATTPQATSPGAATHSPPATAATGAARPPASAAPAAPLAHVFLIVMENHSASEIIGNSSAPFINRLAGQYSLATNYSALTHPSLPNYIALTSGANQGITDDRSPPSAGYAVAARNIADLIEAAGHTWKAYAESIPSPGFASDTGTYATRHVPFLYYKDVLDNPTRRASHVVPFTQLAADLRSAGTTPSYAFITPNLCSDMHDCPISAGDAWLARTVPLILGSPAFTGSRSLLVITWDEGTASDNHVATILAGSAAKRGYRSARPYNHYSLLRTIEVGLGLPPLTANDARATPMNELLRR